MLDLLKYVRLSCALSQIHLQNLLQDMAKQPLTNLHGHLCMLTSSSSLKPSMMSMSSIAPFTSCLLANLEESLSQNANGTTH